MEGSLNKIDILTTAKLYNNRFDEFGRSLKTVGWGSEKDQRLRFEVLFRNIDPKGKKILDVGCGLGDLIPFLDQETGGDYTYIGIDIAQKLIENAREAFTETNKSFYIGDIFSVHLEDVDIAILSGALSYKSENIENYAQNTLIKMFSLSKEA